MRFLRIFYSLIIFSFLLVNGVKLRFRLLRDFVKKQSDFKLFYKLNREAGLLYSQKRVTFSFEVTF